MPDQHSEAAFEEPQPGQSASWSDGWRLPHHPSSLREREPGRWRSRWCSGRRLVRQPQMSKDPIDGLGLEDHRQDPAAPAAGTG